MPSSAEPVAAATAGPELQSNASGPRRPSPLRRWAVVAGIAVLAIGISGLGWWLVREQGDASLAFWGADAQLIESPHRVRARRIGQPWRELQSRPGLSHARRALLLDASFVGPASPDFEPAWRVEFLGRDSRRVTAEFDEGCRRVRSPTTAEAWELAPATSRLWRTALDGDGAGPAASGASS